MCMSFLLFSGRHSSYFLFRVPGYVADRANFISYLLICPICSKNMIRPMPITCVEKTDLYI